MKIIHFQMDQDLDRLEAFLRSQYYENHTADSWLPERLHDLIYRVNAQERDEDRKRSSDYIFLWEDNEEIAACILPDGENIYVSVKGGYEHIFPSMIAFSEENCRPLFAEADEGTIKFWVAVSDSFAYMRKTLNDSGYREYSEKEYINCICPLNADVTIDLPSGFRFFFGEAYPNEENKWSALRLGFHPDWESLDYKAGMNPYRARKNSSLFRDSFECVVVDENAAEGNDVCAYCFVYVDKRTKSALIEPVSTREKYRRKGIGTAMLHGAVMRCKKHGIERCYVDSFGWRKEFYAAAGFFTESSVSFWYKNLK
jgi:GNAT superfamily N-acetyltransferase